MVSREISIMKLLNHPNVIRLYEVIDSEIFLFLVMEYAAGGEIMDFIVTHGKLKERDARRIFRQVVEAIDYCHEVHVIHRDLKAENLLLDSQLGIKLIDFGLSNRWAPGELLKTFCGSPTYTAPELIKRQQYEGPEVDLWSLGVLLYVLVCGSLPFDGNTFQELFTKIINGQYSVPDHVSPECRDLIGRMLVVNPKQRATLDQVREHPWTRESGKPVPKAHIVKMAVPLSEQDMDQEVLEELVNIGFERDYAIQAVLSNSYDDAAATYYLLVESKKRKTPVSSMAGTPTPYNNAPVTGGARAPLPLHAPATNPATGRGGAQAQNPQGVPPAHHAQPPHLTISTSPPPGAMGSGNAQAVTGVPMGNSRAKSTSPAGTTGHGTNGPTPGPIAPYHSPQAGIPPHVAAPHQHNNYYQQQGYHQHQVQQESGNPAYRGQGTQRRRDRSDGKGHRRHHTVGTPGEFPVDEEDAQSMPPPPSPHHHANPAAYAYGASPQHQGLYQSPAAPTQGLASIQHAEVHYANTGRSTSGTSTQPTSPTNSRHRSPHKTPRDEDDLVGDAEHFSTLTITTATPTGSSNSGLTASGSSTGSTASTSTSTTTTTSKRGKHMRMLSNPPPIDEEEEMFYPPQTTPYALSSSPTGPTSTHPHGGSPSGDSGSARPARPTGGLQPRSATMRTEKTRHKDHSRPVTSKKKGHTRRPSFEPDEPTESTPLASSKELKRSSEKKLALSSGSNPSSSSAAGPSPRGRKGSKGALGHPSASSSPPLSDEDAHVISLNPSTPPHSPTLRSGLAEPMIDLKTSSFGLNLSNGSAGNGSSVPSTPHKPVTVKKESRSIVTRVKGFFSRKPETEPRQVRFSINENNTTHEPPELVLSRIVEVLRLMNLPNNHFVSPFCLKTETDAGVVLEVELCQLPIIHLIGVRFRRICGDAWKYTRTCKRILDLLDLNNSKGASSSSLSSSTGTGNATTAAPSSSGHLVPSSSGSSVPKSSGLDKPFSGNGSTNGLSGLHGIHTEGTGSSPSASPIHSGGVLSDPFNAMGSASGGPSSKDSGKKPKRLSSDKAPKKSKQHLSPGDDNTLIVPPISPTKRHTTDSDSTFNTGKFKDESPRKTKAPKLPTLHTSQWEDDEDSSSSGALVSQH
jgi:hypothetical protein